MISPSANCRQAELISPHLICFVKTTSHAGDYFHSVQLGFFFFISLLEWEHAHMEFHCHVKYKVFIDLLWKAFLLLQELTVKVAATHLIDWSSAAGLSISIKENVLAVCSSEPFICVLTQWHNLPMSGYPTKFTPRSDCVSSNCKKPKSYVWGSTALS